MSKQVAKHTAICPSCDSEISFANEPRIGAEVDCASCGAALEVVFLRPIELDWANTGFEDDDEDWEDDRWGDY